MGLRLGLRIELGLGSGLGLGLGLGFEAAGRARGGVVGEGARGTDDAHRGGRRAWCVGRELDEHLR